MEPLALIVLAVLAQPFAGWLAESRMPAPAGPLDVQVLSCGDHPAMSCTLSACDGEGCPQRILIHPEHITNRRVFMHEIGHAYDNTVLGERERGWFLGDREQLASAYSLCAIRGRRIKRQAVGWLSMWWPTPAVHRQACQVLRAPVLWAEPEGGH